jgi:hypothetical protein
MRTRLLAVASLAFVLMALTLPARAAPAETLHFSFKGQFAEALFSSTDPSGCVVTEVFVAADDGRVKTGPGMPEVESVAFIFISQFDVCTQTQLLAADGFAVLAPDAFQIDRQLTAATLTATIEVFDFVSGTSFPVEVNVSWTGFGDTFSVKDRFHLKAPGFKVNSRFDGTFRDATASGTVTDGTTNFTPEPAVFADMGSVKQGEVDIIHG